MGQIKEFRNEVCIPILEQVRIAKFKFDKNCLDILFNASYKNTMKMTDYGITDLWYYVENGNFLVLFVSNSSKRWMI